MFLRQEYSDTCLFLLLPGSRGASSASFMMRYGAASPCATSLKLVSQSDPSCDCVTADVTTLEPSSSCNFSDKKKKQVKELLTPVDAPFPALCRKVFLV